MEPTQIPQSEPDDDKKELSSMLTSILRKEMRDACKYSEKEIEALYYEKHPEAIRRSPEYFRTEAKKISSNIHETYRTLQAIVNRHEETIHRRWTKYSKNQRTKLLLGCWPGMAAHHRPDYKIMWRVWQKRERETSGTDHPEHLMWPYINLEDLAKTKNLLLFINARARHHPSEFASADLEGAKIGIKLGLLPVLVCISEDLVMILNGARDEESYGRVITTREEDGLRSLLIGKQFRDGEGLMVLEIQDRLLRFLVDCCRTILHDIPADRLTSDEYPIQPEPQLKTEAESSGFESPSVMAAEAPYRLPSKIDFDRMQGTLKAKVDELKDHIRALREDPEYFVAEMNTVRSHRIELLPDTLGNPDHLVFQYRRLFTARIFSELITDAYRNLEVFSELHRQAEVLRTAHAQLDLSPLEELPESFLMQVLTFRYFLARGLERLVEHYNLTFRCSPNMRGYFLRTPPEGNRLPRWRDLPMGPKQLLDLTEEVVSRTRNVRLLGIPIFLDELDRLVENEADVSKMISEKVAAIIGDLSIHGGCMAQLDQFQPWASGFDNAMDPQQPLFQTFLNSMASKGDGPDPEPKARKPVIEAEYSEFTDRLAALTTHLQPERFLKVAKLADVSGGRFRYPTGGRRTREVVEARRMAEANLDMLWEAVDQICEPLWTHDTARRARELLSEEWALERTPEWDEEKEGRKKKPEKQGAAGEVDMLLKPLSTLFGGTITHEKEPARVVTTTNVKTKTKGVATAVADLTGTPVHPDEAVPEEKPKPIQVDARSLKVFRILFFNPGVTSSPGEMAWHDFTHAMTSTGLFTANKLYGSAWQFKRLDTDRTAHIMFHEPHPKGKVPFVTARGMGRRLTRAFGWTGDSFVLKQQQKPTA